MKKFLIPLLIFLLMIVSCAAPGNEDPGEEDLPDPGTDPVNDEIVRLIDPSQLSLFRAGIEDATALGIRTGESAGEQRSFVVSRTTENSQNYLVKSTTEYIPDDPEFDDSGLTSVTFTAITTSENATEITGEKRLVAAGSKDFPHIGSIAFASSEGFTYTVTGQDDDVLIENITDNDSNDLDPEVGVIRIGDLEKGNKYMVTYLGTSTEVTITQDEIDGEIDKLYVLSGYTFISYVPQGMSERPSDNDLEYDTDGIAMYDKTDYFASNTRQSFIIDNESGYIYPIENFHIRKIEGGCLLSDSDNYIYDFRITDSGSLEIYSIFSNPSITWYNVFKDKYGHVYIYNNRLNEYYPDTNTFFFRYEYETRTDPFYMLNSNGEAVKFQQPENNSAAFSSISVINENGSERELTSSDNFDIYYWPSRIHWLMRPYKAVNGRIYGYIRDTESSIYSYGPTMFMYDPFENMTYITYFGLQNGRWYFGDYALVDYDVILMYSENEEAVYCLSNAWDYFVKVMENAVQIDDNRFAEISIDTLPSSATKVLSNCRLSDDRSSFLTYGPQGNTYYDIVVERGSDGKVVVKSYISGTYEEPQKKITLQPINR